MINSWEEICRRYDAIKDHKPRASKKLKELGEILASAYTFSPQKADEMWQYIIELNISDNIEFSKFYIAQVFNKLTDFMPSEDAVSLAMMQPERIRLMLLYGYSGGTAHHVIYTIIGFLVQQNRFDEAIEIVDMLQDKSAQDYEQEKEPLQYFGNLATSLRQSNEEKESSLPEFYFRYAIKKESLDNFFSVCEMTYPDSEVWAISYASRMLEGTELADKELLEKCLWTLCSIGHDRLFGELLYANRDQLTDDEATKWIEELASQELLKGLPLFTYSDEAERNEECEWFVSAIKRSDSALASCFMQFRCDGLTARLLNEWIRASDWRTFIKHLSIAFNNADEYRFDSYVSYIKNSLSRYEEFKRSEEGNSMFFFSTPPAVVRDNITDYLAAISRVCTLTTGIDRYDELLDIVRVAVTKETGTVEIMTDAGLEVKAEKRSTTKRFRDYCAKETKRIPDYDLGHKHTEIHEYFREIGREKAMGSVEVATYLSKYSEITSFLFLKNTGCTNYKADMILGCLKSGDVAQSTGLFDLLIQTTNYPNYANPNGWADEFVRVIHHVLSAIIRSKSETWMEPYEDSVVVEAAKMANAALKYFDADKQRMIKSDLLKLGDSSSNLDSYISEIMDQVALLTAEKKPRGFAKEKWKVLRGVTDSFSTIAGAGRLEVIAEVLRRLSVNSEDANTAINAAMRIGNENIVALYEQTQDVFASWLASPVSDNEVLRVARAMGETGNRETYLKFKQQVIQKRGLVSELSHFFKHDQNNAIPITVLNTNGAIVDFLYYTYSCHAMRVFNCSFHFGVLVSKSEIDRVKLTDIRINKTHRYRDEETICYYPTKGQREEGTFYLDSEWLEEKEIKSLQSISFKIQLLQDGNVKAVSPLITIGYDSRTEQFQKIDGAKL